jgi:hypothetical protein
MIRSSGFAPNGSLISIPPPVVTNRSSAVL